MNTINQTLNLLFGGSLCPEDQTGALAWLLRGVEAYVPCATWIVEQSGTILASAFAGEHMESSRLQQWTQHILAVQLSSPITQVSVPGMSIQLLGVHDVDAGTLIMAFESSLPQSPEHDRTLQHWCESARFVLRYIRTNAHNDISRRRLRQLQSERLTLQSTYHQVLIDSLAEGAKQNERLEKLVAERSHDLQEALIYAEHANEAKSQFLANMSHEIRTPLTAIMGYAELLRDVNLPQQPSEWVGVMTRNSEHLLNIVNDILDLSKIESGKMPIERLAISPVELVDQVVEAMLPKAREKSLAFDIQYLTEMPSVIYCDPTRLRQILTNLLSNAVKFTTQGGITLKLSLARHKNTSEMFQIDVVDSGIGMNPQQLEKVFSPFTQADVSTTRRFGGTGLGLTISRQLAVRMGGKLRVKSQPDIGSTFTLTLPNDVPAQIIPAQNVDSSTSIIKTDAKGTPSMDSTSQSLIGTIRVLLAEDGPDNQRLISLILTAAKMHVDIADNGQIAFEKAMLAEQAGEPYHVILMDMQMPVLDGLAATQQLRQAGYQRPVVSLTANAMESDRRRCLEAGCNDYAQKPINREKLIATIVKYATQPVAPESTTQNAALPAFNPSPLVSEWANDPDMAELVQDYVMNLPTRVAAISAALSSEKMDELRTLVHQVKGSAGGYGFNPISEQAGQVELLVHTQAEMERIRKEVDALVELCNRASAS